MFKQLLFLAALSLLAQSSPLYAQSTKDFEPALYESLEWRCVGPFRGGRSCAVTGVPDQPNLFYFGSTGGGVWKTKDGGQTWENISDGYFGGSIGAVAVSTYDPNVLYVGGGEKTVRGNVSFGYGIWKSVNGGKTWEQTGLEESRHIGRIRIHPRNPDIAYAAVMGDLYKSSEERGVYRTTDGGDTWEQILFANADAGAVDLLLDPTNPRVVYASTWRIRRTPYSLESGGEGSALWKSTDGGDTWENLTLKEGFPKGPLGIIGIAVSPVNADRVWALVEASKGGVLRSEDGGESWSRINDSRALRQRAWYYSRIYADPKDEDIVYVMNVRYHKSKDGGRTFKAHAAPHGDHHDLWIAPEDPDRMIIGDDGGAQVTFDGGDNWTTYHNQPTAQFYRVTTDNDFPYRIYAAQQDNSTIRIKHRTDGSSIGESDWESTAGGESAHLAVDPLDNEIVYGGSYGGYLTMKNHRTGERRAINVWPENPMGYGAEGMKYRFQWNFPLFFSPHNPDQLYAASNHLHRSTDGGQSWAVISPDLTRNDSTKLGPSGGPITKDNTGVEYYCTIFAAVESPFEKGLIWTGSDDGLVHLSRDGGDNWDNITPKDFPEWLMVNSIDPDPFNPGSAFVAGTRYKLGDYQPYLYHVTEYGKNWRLMVDGIAREHFTRVVRADPDREGLLYAGTESGMYLSFDNGVSWAPFQLNLPVVPITDLTVKERNLIAATQGRSLWIIDDLTPIHQMNTGLDTTAIHLFQPIDSYLMDGRQRKNSKTAGTNHPGGVTIHYYVPETIVSDSQVVALAFYEETGKHIRTFSTDAEEKADQVEVKAGSNTFNWDLRYPKAKEVDGMILWWAGLSGPEAVPGYYTVKLMTPQDTLEQPWQLKKDPRITATAGDLQARFDFMQAVNAKVSEAHQVITDIREVRKQMQPFIKRWKSEEAYADLLKQAEAIDSVMTEVEEALYQTRNKSRQDPLNFPIRLTNKLAHINALIGSGDFPPTDQDREVRDTLTQQIDQQLTRFYTLKKIEIPAFNEAVKAKAVNVIMLEENP